ncbi:MAG: DNA-3-methyladenine glycosylase [Planctomycetaceae bacterium]|nr:DNA-3-methyladenine glycosylase [Planctomycetaceae bacterium]
MRPLTDPSFFDRDPATVAQELLGTLLCRRGRDGLTVGRIVETEAYLASGDSASHSWRGPGRKNASMFAEPGSAYVYTIHARQCFNVVTEPEGIGSAVLIRALEPVTGVALMRRRRRTDNIRDLCRGPARLCEAFAVDRSLDGWNLLQGRRLWLALPSVETPVPGPDSEMCRSVRIGLSSNADAPLRFFFTANAFVSGPAKLNRGT